MTRWLMVGLMTLAQVTSADAQQPRLLPDATVAALARELSGEAAKRNLEYLTRLHRMAGSRDFNQAVEFMVAQAGAVGLVRVRVDSFPTDGKRFYGTQRSRPAWQIDFGELWELGRQGDQWVPAERLASWDAAPITIANLSEGGSVESELVDVGDGTSEADYAGRDVRGKLVLAAQQPAAVGALAIAKYGAAGIVSYAQNQRNAWWGEDENLIRWGHYDAFTPYNRLGFMVSLKQGRLLRQRLARGETIRMRAEVRGGRRPGVYQITSALIEGADPALRGEEIAFSCHLDHQKPGANDNASGCVTILEIGRTLAKLVADGAIPRPARTLRFIWPPEIEGTLALLTERPEVRDRIKAVVHMDMVGGGPVTKAQFQVKHSPASLPTFVNDVADAWTLFVNQQSAEFAATGRARYPLVAPEGGKEPFAGLVDDFTLGSDHEIYTEGSFAIPAIYLAQWPDRYIHTNFDLPANIDPTVLKRAAFIGAASALVLANATSRDAATLWETVAARTLERTSTLLQRRLEVDSASAAALTRFHWDAEKRRLASFSRFFAAPREVIARAESFQNNLESMTGRAVPAPPASGPGAVVYQRTAVKGPMSAFAYDYLNDHYGAERAGQLRLMRHQGLRGGGAEYSYELLNFVDGRRTAQQIRDALTAVYGPVPLEAVLEFLAALESIGVVRRNVPVTD